jgi:hypothetical protein
LPVDAPKQLHFDLFFREAAPGIYWKLEEGGVTLDAEGLAWKGEAGERRYRYSDLASIRLCTTIGGKVGNIYFCVLRFRDGTVVTFYSGTSRGQIDERGASIYADFIRILHARLNTLKPAGIEYKAGQTATRYYIVLGAVIVLISMVVVLPFVLTVIYRKWEALIAVLVGAGFCWPMWRLAQASRPRIYSPDAVPDDVVP